jgi:hypothetical protein
MERERNSIVQVKFLMGAAREKEQEGKRRAPNSRPPAVEGSLDLFPLYSVFGIRQAIVLNFAATAEA